MIEKWQSIFVSGIFGRTKVLWQWSDEQWKNVKYLSYRYWKVENQVEYMLRIANQGRTICYIYDTPRNIALDNVS